MEAQREQIKQERLQWVAKTLSTSTLATFSKLLGMSEVLRRVAKAPNTSTKQRIEDVRKIVEI
jgi:hypothetical protein